MDLYILRWGVLWAACLVLALLAADDEVSALLFVFALVATMASFFGLVSMVLLYRRAVRALRDRAA
ncbi:hypothetical protein J7E62_20430 [Variovorax paradoxus]|nr:hypothetical protein [Variovorax paradoxus]